MAIYSLRSTQRRRHNTVPLRIASEPPAIPKSHPIWLPLKIEGRARIRRTKPRIRVTIGYSIIEKPERRFIVGLLKNLNHISNKPSNQLR